MVNLSRGSSTRGIASAGPLQPDKLGFHWRFCRKLGVKMRAPK